MGLGFSTVHAIGETSLTGGVWLSSTLGQVRAPRERDSLRVDATQWRLGKRSFFWANRSESTHRLEFKS